MFENFILNIITWLVGMLVPFILVYLGSNFIFWGEYLNVAAWETDARAVMLIVTFCWGIFWTSMWLNY